MSVGVNPVFLKTKDIPESAHKRPTVLEMCLAGERAAGNGSVVGAEQISGLWRIYPATQEARTELLVQGMTLRGTVLQVSNTNPYILKNDSGFEKPSTKVWIDNIPISVADSEIEHSLTKVGCELRSAIKAERARDADSRLTRFLTGRRFVYISVPSVPLEKSLKVSLFTAKIYHREQKQTENKTVICSKCLEQGHHASTCDKEIVCRACKQSGHKKGDPVCHLTTSNTTDNTSENKGVTAGEGGIEGEDVSAGEGVNADDGVNEESECEGQSEDSYRASDRMNERTKKARGRPKERQAVLDASLQLKSPPLHRSATPKRPRSKEGTSPREAVGKGKQQKRDTGHTGRHASSAMHKTSGNT